MRERDNPPINRLGIPMKSIVWKPSNSLETVEHNIYLDNISVGSGCLSSSSSSIRKVENDEEEVCLLTCYNYLSIFYIPWPFPPVWGVADNTKRQQKQWGFYSHPNSAGSLVIGISYNYALQKDWLNFDAVVKAD